MAPLMCMTTPAGVWSCRNCWIRPIRSWPKTETESVAWPIACPSLRRSWLPPAKTYWRAKRWAPNTRGTYARLEWLGGEERDRMGTDWWGLVSGKIQHQAVRTFSQLCFIFAERQKVTNNATVTHSLTRSKVLGYLKEQSPPQKKNHLLCNPVSLSSVDHRWYFAECSCCSLPYI